MTNSEFKNMLNDTFESFFGFAPVPQEQPKEVSSSNSTKMTMTKDELESVLDSTFKNFFNISPKK